MANKTLVLTGWGWMEYPVAAAAALRALGGAADVLGMSRRRLPEFLEALDANSRRVVIVGVSLGGDEARLAAALKSLRQKGVKVEWVSGVLPADDQRTSLAPLMKCFVKEPSVLDAVGERFGVDVGTLRPYADETRRGAKSVAAWQELVDAAMFTYRNYQDEKSYAKAIRYLADGVASEAWDAECVRLVEHYRRFGTRELVGKSPQMRTLQDRVNRVAAHPDARVLILGESGTGKETVALQIHNKSARRGEPFVAFNCASVARDLLEARFFGHEKGAFTDAKERRKGLFELADGGTLFLDEIGEMSAETQALLLRVLEGGRFMRVGGSEEVAVDVRLITATNRNLPRLVREGKFRADLFQRLNVVQLRVPPLREHLEDVRDIADGWWFHRYRRHLAEAQVAALMGYDYPGNVRELLNLLERASVLGESDFAALVREHREMNEEIEGQGAPPDDLEGAIRWHVRRIYERSGRNIMQTAKALQRSRNNVKKYLAREQ